MARLIRVRTDPEDAFTEAYKALELKQPDDKDDPLAVRIARLADVADEDRGKLIKLLQKQIPPNRPTMDWGGAIEPAVADDSEADVEAEELVKYVRAEKKSALEMMENLSPPAFSVAQRLIGGYFAGEELPTAVYGLINYPLKRPCLFTINVGQAPWKVWDICCAFSEQYARIYEQPEKYGIWGHDLSDLWIGQLLYFPKKRLIYPLVDS
jgi:hypothetical protein